jgi:hypothetical protein
MCAVSVSAAEQAPAAQGQQSARVWTNEDLEELRAKGGISIVGPEPGSVPEATTAGSGAAQDAPVYNSYLEDPAWYAEQALGLQAELDARTAELNLARQNLALARSGRQTMGGVNLGQIGMGLTHEEGIAILESQVLEVQTWFDDLRDLARRNYIAPGVLRPRVG